MGGRGDRIECGRIVVTEDCRHAGSVQVVNHVGHVRRSLNHHGAAGEPARFELSLHPLDTDPLCRRAFRRVGNERDGLVTEVGNVIDGTFPCSGPVRRTERLDQEATAGLFSGSGAVREGLQSGDADIGRKKCPGLRLGVVAKADT